MARVKPREIDIIWKSYLCLQPMYVAYILMSGSRLFTVIIVHLCNCDTL